MVSYEMCGRLLQMSEVVGFDIKPEPSTSLCNMLEYNLHKFTEK